MADGEIKVGDVVRLKSGGPAMVVVEAILADGEEEHLACNWFDGSTVQSAIFPAACLTGA